jgi:hypothetical protein
MVVADRMMLDPQPLAMGRQQAAPNPWRAVIGRHSDGAGIVPEAAVDHLGERNAAMPGNDSGDVGEAKLAELGFSRRRGEYKPIVGLDIRVDHGQPQSVYHEIETTRQ